MNHLPHVHVDRVAHLHHDGLVAAGERRRLLGDAAPEPTARSSEQVVRRRRARRRVGAITGAAIAVAAIGGTYAFAVEAPGPDPSDTLIVGPHLRAV